MPHFYDPALAEGTREIDAIRRHLHVADSESIHMNSLVRERAATVKAFAYVWLSATLEQFVRTVLQALMRDLTARQLLRCDIQPCLLAVADFSAFDSLRDVGGLAMWTRRVEVLGAPHRPEIAVFSDATLPLDGRTLRPEHFDTICRVLNLPGRPVPTPRHAFALNDLAEGRNSIAHGHVSPLTFGRRKVMADVVRLVDQIEEIVFETTASLDEYTSRAHYLR